MFQNAGARRIELLTGRAPPDSSGATKPWMPCRSGLTPVATVVQSDGEVDGSIERSTPEVPSATMRENRTEHAGGPLRDDAGEVRKLTPLHQRPEHPPVSAVDANHHDPAGGPAGAGLGGGAAPSGAGAQNDRQEQRQQRGHRAVAQGAERSHQASHLSSGFIGVADWQLKACANGGKWG
jgi:hypothetical protein